MTTINAQFVYGVDTPADGALRCVPTRRYIEDETVVLPSALIVLVKDGVAQFDLTPSTSEWCWRVIEGVPGGIDRFVTVPDSVTPVEYVDLVDVDPTTFDPAAEPVASWWATAADLQTSLAALNVAAGASYLTEDPDSAGLYTIPTLNSGANP